MTFEATVRQWAEPYAELPRNKWAWSIRDSLNQYSTDGKLREDVRRNTGVVMTPEERKEIKPLAEQVKTGVAEEAAKDRPLKAIYHDVELGIKTADWTPPAPPKPTGEAANEELGSRNEESLEEEVKNTPAPPPIPEPSSPAAKPVCEPGKPCNTQYIVTPRRRVIYR